MKTIRFVLLLALSTALVFSNCGDDEVKVIECEGSCTCDQDTRTCACQGGTECVVEGYDDVTLVCEGNARCELSCGDRCHVECPGTAGCNAEMGDDSSAVCNGTGDCEYTCSGDCEVNCPGVSRCVLRCPEDAECQITDCPAITLQECGNGVLVCRSTCTD